jgi:hypothetical protein
VYWKEDWFATTKAMPPSDIPCELHKFMAEDVQPCSWLFNKGEPEVTAAGARLPREAKYITCAVTLTALTLSL